MPLDWQTIEIIKAGLCLGIIPVLIIGWRRRHFPSRLLWGLLVIGVAAYFNFGAFHPVKYPHTIHYYDMYHYYFGGKYFSELGYFDLYAATVVADRDGNRFFDDIENFKEIRDLRSDQFIPWREALADSNRIKARFTPERWKEFQGDLASFQKHMPSRHWAEALADYGFNGSPVWVLTGGLAANFLSAESLAQLVFLGWIDVFLMVIAFGLLYRAFGLKVLAFSVFFFGLNYTHRYQHMSGSLLRLDWLASLVACLALLKWRRAKLAGFFLGWATALRIFPALFAVGIAIRGLVKVYRGGPFVNRDLKTLIVAVGTAVAFFVGSLMLPSGWQGWTEYAENISHHSQRLTVKRIAVPYIFLFAGESSYEEAEASHDGKSFNVVRYERYKSSEIAIWLIRIAMLAAFTAVCFRCRSWQVFSLGLVLVWGFANPARYYWAQLVLLIPLLLDRPWDPKRLVATVFLFLVMASSYIINHFTGYYPLHQFHMSLALGILFSYLLWVLWKEEIPGQPEPGASLGDQEGD